ncbi:MAG TPA: aldo/keto reductase [Thermoanaerobaculaceae bacterium]|nr:aldo/keto reductase [Thermoanaerobaculaceae bacterium]
MSEHDEEKPTIERRDLLKLGAAATVGYMARGVVPDASASLPPLPINPVTPGAMPTRNLGRTGYRVGIFSLGGQAAVEQPDNEAVAVPIVEKALDIGVNYIDTSARYGGAERWSERYIGQVMKRRRREAFLATKTHDRTRDGSLKLLEKSLQLLQTDHIDLWQIHNLAKMEEVEQIFAPDGAVQGLLKAREQGLVRFLGVTGHADPAVLGEAIRRFSFDTVLMAVNAADPHHLSFAAELLPLAVEKEMGIIGMKIPARGRILSSWTPPPPDQQRPGQVATRSGTITMQEALRYVLSLPVSTVIVGCDTVAQVEENVRLARAFTPMSANQMAELTTRTEPVKRQALFFRRWEG